MRDLRLTHEEIELILTALGIAEKQYTELHKDLAKLTNVRGGYLSNDNRLHEIACKFADLNCGISDSQKDV